MLISHEVPLYLMEQSKIFNDYQFILPSYWGYIKYKEFMSKYRCIPNSLIISDCGLYEGDNFTNTQLIQFINECQPDYQIIPDVWNDANQCARNVKYWVNTIKSQLPKKTKLISVIQCTDIHIGTLLYQQYLDLGVDGIAFNHSSEAYPKIFPHKNLSISKTLGRILFINSLLEKGIIKENIWHHLLGCNIPSEFLYYNNSEYNFLKSCDTSSPIIWGCKKIKYNNLLTKLIKPTEKVDIFFNDYLDQEQLECINYNIKQFKEYCNFRDESLYKV